LLACKLLQRLLFLLCKLHQKLLVVLLQVPKLATRFTQNQTKITKKLLFFINLNNQIQITYMVSWALVKYATLIPLVISSGL
jgi:hypothetical protein